MTNTSETWIPAALCELRKRNLYRRLHAYPGAGGKIEIDGRTYLNFSSNDYLNLARDARVINAAQNALAKYGAGAGASRLVTGTLPVHADLEQTLADWKERACALVFGSGYLTNVGVVPALVGRTDHVFLDRLAHASLVDASELSRARVHRFRHNDTAHLADLLTRHTNDQGRRLIATESVFSMDGDIAPLRALAGLAADHHAMLLVDEAHATGVFGPTGTGLVCAAGLGSEVTVSMGTLSKALGSCGGFVAGSEQLRDWLVNRSRAFIYTTGLPPASAAAALCAVRLLRDGAVNGAELLSRAEGFRHALRAAGFDTGTSRSQIIPIIVGTAERALLFAETLKDQGIIAVAIRPPTVPEGTARIRLSVTLAHTQQDLDRAVDIIIRSGGIAGVI